MEENRLDTSLKNADTFKDILVNESNDDVIIPISATFDKAVLHIGIGNKTGVNIEKPAVKKGKKLATSIEHATRRFLKNHFIVENKHILKGKDKRRKNGRNKRGTRTEKARIRRIEKRTCSEELPYLLFKGDTTGFTESTDKLCMTEFKVSTTKILPYSIPLGHTIANSKKSESTKQHVLLDSQAESNLHEIDVSTSRDSNSLDQDVSARSSQYSKTPDFPTRKLFETQSLGQAAAPTETRHTRSLIDVARKFSEKGLNSEADSGSVSPHIIALSDLEHMVSQAGHLSQTNSLNTHDGTSSVNEIYTIPERVFIDKEARSKASTDNVSLEHRVVILPENGAPHRGSSHSARGELITTDNNESKISETKFPVKTELSQPLTDSSKDSPELMEETMEKSRLLVQYISQQAVGNIATQEGEITVTTEPRPIDQVVSKLGHAIKTDVEELVAIRNTEYCNEINTGIRVSEEFPHETNDTTRDLQTSTESLYTSSVCHLSSLCHLSSACHPSSVLTTDGQSDIWGDYMKRIIDVEVEMSEPVPCNKSDKASDVSAMDIASLSEILPCAKSDLTAIDVATPFENIARLFELGHSEQYDHAGEDATQITERAISSSKTTPHDQVDVTAAFESVTSLAWSAPCEHSRITTEAVPHSSSSTSQIDGVHESTSAYTTADTEPPADVSLSDIVSSVPADGAEDGSQDDNVFGILTIYRKSDLHCAVNITSGTKLTTNKTDFGYMYFSL